MTMSAHVLSNAAKQGGFDHPHGIYRGSGQSKAATGVDCLRERVWNSPS